LLDSVGALGNFTQKVPFLKETKVVWQLIVRRKLLAGHYFTLCQNWQAFPNIENIELFSLPAVGSTL